MPSVTVVLPRTLMGLAGDQRQLAVEVGAAAPVARVLDDLAVRHPVLERRLRDETGAVRRYVNVYVDDEDIRQLDGTATLVRGGQTIRVIQSVAGG